MNNTLVTDTISHSDSSITVNGNYRDSVMQTFTPKHWLTWFDSISYKKFDTITYVSSDFRGHSLHSTTHIPMEVRQENRNWLFGVLILMTILYLYIQNNFYNRYSQVKRAFLVKRYYSQLVRDGNIFKERIVIPIYLIFLMSFSLMLYSTLLFLIDVSQIPFSRFNIYLLILLGLIVSQFIKSMVINISGELFYSRNETAVYQLDTLLFISFISLFLLPTMWFHTYYPSGIILIFIWSIYLIFSIIRLGKAIIVWQKVFTIFKLFLYLCTLEVLPIVIIIKVLTILFN